jgi:hypothetical protein
MAKKKAVKRKAATSGTKTGKKKAKKTKNSLVGNINRRKKAGKSRKKKDTTISDGAYSDMEKGWPKTKAKKRVKARKK